MRCNLIHIHYDALNKNDTGDVQVSEEFLKKAKGLLGSSARDELVRMFDPVIRRQAFEVARREVNPMSLYESGREGLLDALKLYKIGKTQGTFSQFATAFVRQAMQLAKQRAS